MTSGARAPFGWHRFSVRAPDVAAYQRAFFVGYGTNNLGIIDLARNRGALSLAVEPAAATLRLEGPYFKTVLTNSTGFTNTLPVGAYRGQAVFEHWTQPFNFRVESNRNCILALQPALSALNLVSDPPGARFTLLDMDRARPVAEGKTPRFINALPAGRYHARLWRGDYLKETNYTLARGATQALAVPFEYGQIAFASTPADALIYSNDTEVGRTPATFRDLKPGRYHYLIAHPGYYPVEYAVDLLGETNLSFSTNLMNILHARSMANAREAARLEPPDYELAIGNLKNALKALPGDSEAATLLAKYETILRLEARRGGDLREIAEAEARRRHPKAYFQKLADRRPYAELFDTQTLRFQTKLARVHSAVLSALAADAHWEVLLDLRPDTNTCHIEARCQSLKLGQRNLVVVAGQVSDTEVELDFKLWELALKIDSDGALARELTDANLVPVHRDYLKTSHPELIDKRRQTGIADFKSRLVNALR